MARPPGWCRLSRRARRSFLQCAPPLCSQRGRGAVDAAGCRDLSEGRADRRSSAGQRQPSAHHRLRAHAIEPPALRRLDGRAHSPRGHFDRTSHRRALRADPGAPAPSRTRLPRLPRHRAAGAAIRRRSPRSRRHAGDRDRHPYLRLGALDPRQQARSPGCSTPARQWRADPSPQYPRTALLPLRRMQLLTHPMLDQLGQLGLSGMAQAFAELEASDETAALTHADWLGLLVDRELTHRRDKRLAARLRYARLRQQASVEDVDYRAPRGLDRALFQKLTNGEWIDAHDNLILCGPTGVGKSWLACALGHRACRDNLSVLYQRIPRLFSDLALARGDGRYPRLMRALGGVKLLILDDWGLEPLTAEQRHDLLEIVEDRYGRGATLITSQIPVDRWHDLIGEPTLADAILDRIVHNAHRLQLSGDSLRKQKAPKIAAA